MDRTRLREPADGTKRIGMSEAPSWNTLESGAAYQGKEPSFDFRPPRATARAVRRYSCLETPVTGLGPLGRNEYFPIKKRPGTIQNNNRTLRTIAREIPTEPG